MKKLKILISAGGTGGHLIPAQALGMRLLAQEEDVVFAATGLSKNSLMDKDAFPIYDIPSSSLKKKIWITLYHWLRGIKESFSLFRSYKPDVVVGFGSYHTFPVLVTATLLRVPIVLYEPNCTLGKVNQFFAKRAKRVAVQFPIQRKHVSFCEVPFLPWKEIHPISAALSRRHLSLEEDVFTFLIFGGSQGADFINEGFKNSVETLLSSGKKFQVIHLTGSDNATEKLRFFYKEKKILAFVKTFEKHIFPLFDAADFVMCRSGASTMGELVTWEKPALVIPYPYAHGHQEDNGRFFSDRIKGGFMVLQKKENEREIVSLLSSLLRDPQQLFLLQKNIQNFKLEEKKKNKKPLETIVRAVGRREI